MTRLAAIWPLNRRLTQSSIEFPATLMLPAAIWQRALEGLYIATPTVSRLLAHGSISHEPRR